MNKLRCLCLILQVSLIRLQVSEGGLVTCSNRRCTATSLPLRTLGERFTCFAPHNAEQGNTTDARWHICGMWRCMDSCFNVKGDTEHLSARTATLCYPNLVPHSLTATVEKVWQQKGTYTSSSAASVPTWCINSAHQLLLPHWREHTASRRGHGGQQSSRP